MEFAIFIVIMVLVAIVGAIKKQNSSSGQPNARMQKMIERIQAQQGGNQPVQFQGQFTQAQGQSGPPVGQQSGTVQGSQQVAAALQALMQAGRQPAHYGERSSPGQAAAPQQFQQGPPQQAPYQAGPYQPTYQPPATWQPAAPAHNYQQRGPQPKPNLDARVRDLMKAGNEVTAVRVLSDELDLGLLAAQQYARNLVAPAASKTAEPSSAPVDEEKRYVGSAAIADSMFNLDRDEETWASGWVDTPEPEDRSDMDELWQTVRNPPRPTGNQ
ncbi:hypothetical protein E1263_08430 [Kribbella antibiotica]|uniref:Uncharacterized protein n=1 Tax=Kribbella antibiotica TaxID=190195 RepID=A0A4R4ZQI2_9ACTN|nr:hypothetical protein [Kribbella antibiotica]TDD61203.1 hypothetical protein E1263_08430 [Kribbella antibiotica]